MAVPERLVSDDAVIVTQRMQYRCGCGTLFEASMPIDCPMDVSLAHWGSLRCPSCGDRDSVYVGQDRTLAEDRVFDWGFTYDERVEAWARNGEYGQSSRAIFRRMLARVPGAMSSPPEYRGSDGDWRDLMSRTAGPLGIPREAPLDTSDLRRCVLLLGRIHEWVPRMAEMADVSPSWAALAPRWDEVVALYRVEVGKALDRAPAPLTNDLLRSIQVAVVA